MKKFATIIITFVMLIGYLICVSDAAADLMDQWIFNQGNLKGSDFTNITRPDYGTKSKSFNASIQGPINFTQITPILKLDGKENYLLIKEEVEPNDLPQKEMSVEAWVLLESGIPEGVIIGYFSKENITKYSWIMGYNKSHFTFGISTDAQTTFIESTTAFEKDRWYHVTGTYDGSTMKIFVDGIPEAESSAQTGEIIYHDGNYVIGAYYISDNIKSMFGCLHKINVHDAALTDNEVYISYIVEGPVVSPEVGVYMDSYDTVLGPYIEFSDSGSAIVRWKTDAAEPSVLVYGENDAFGKRLEDSAPKTDHIIEIPDLKHNTCYSYAIVTEINGKERISNTYLCDTFFNYNRPVISGQLSPYKGKQSNFYKELANKILSETGITQGYCLDIGCDNGNLAYELAKQSNLKIIGVDTDPKTITSARNKLREAGVYGSHVSLRGVNSLSELPFQANTFNLIVSSASLNGDIEPDSIQNYKRLLRPNGGMAYFDRSSDVFRREPLSGTGIWSHQYGGPHNASFGGESLSNATGTDDLKVQWIGRPGPRAMVDRNSRVPAPLAMNGRLFTQGFNRIIAQDSYNGTILWSLEVPNSIRMNMPRDASNWCADNESVFMVIRDHCWRINAAKGHIVQTYELIPGPRKDWEYNWGYVAQSGDTIWGSALKAGSSYTGFWAQMNWYDRHTAGYKDQVGYGTGKVCRDNIFALDKNSGRKVWIYEKGVIINSTITIGDERVYVVECRHQSVLAAENRQIALKELWQDQFLVALDQKTGEKLWEEPLHLTYDIPVIYLVYGDEALLLVTSVDSKKSYDLYTFEAHNGRKRWQQTHPWTGEDHSGHMQHPVIVNGKVFLEPQGYDLKNGTVITKNMGLHEGCATYIATTDALIYRGKDRETAMWDFATNDVSTWHRLRPGCWLTTIAADGMILSPESGGGCSCGNWMETSIAFAPIVCFPPNILPSEREFLASTEVELLSPQENTVIRYTLDGTHPTKDSPVFTHLILLDKTTTIHARAYMADGIEKSSEIMTVYRQLIPRIPDNPENLFPGLVYRYYEKELLKMPDFSKLELLESGTVKTFDIGVRKQDKIPVLYFTGFIEISIDGLYTFYTDSSAGSMLHIGDNVVVNNDGLHGLEEKSGKIALKAGKHPITVTYFNSGDETGLSVSYEGPGIVKQVIPGSVLRHSE